VRVKQQTTHIVRAQLTIREQLAKSLRSMTNQLRGLLKLSGCAWGK
jgi:hypothetical protein